MAASAAAIAALSFTSGCGSDASYVEAGGARSLISTNKINVADWNNAADAMVNSLLASPAFKNFKKPVLLEVSEVVNRTSERIDTDMLTKRITIALTNSGLCAIKSSDKKSVEVAEYNRFMNNQGTLPAAQITISGKILEDRESVGRDREVTYTFQMSLNSDGVQVWEDQKQIAKQSTQSVF